MPKTIALLLVTITAISTRKFGIPRVPESETWSDWPTRGTIRSEWKIKRVRYYIFVVRSFHGQPTVPYYIIVFRVGVVPPISVIVTSRAVAHTNRSTACVVGWYRTRELDRLGAECDMWIDRRNTKWVLFFFRN